MTAREQEITQRVVEILRSTISPSKIILFGSRAKGISYEGSDFDIAVDREAGGAAQEREIAEKIDEVAGLYKVDLVFLPNVDEGFRDIILKTGKVIYEGRN